MVSLYLKHFIKIIVHKYYVFQESRKCGIIWQGLVHDLSKFLPSEFKQARYYTGNRSAIDGEKAALGYSHSWIVHTNRNPHHWEYWYDPTDRYIAPIPEKYQKGMACDIIAASKAYLGKDYTPQKPVEFLTTAGRHPKEVIDMVLPHMLKLLGLEK